MTAPPQVKILAIRQRRYRDLSFLILPILDQGLTPLCPEPVLYDEKKKTYFCNENEYVAHEKCALQ